jgi:hypothetical protein
LHCAAELVVGGDGDHRIGSVESIVAGRGITPSPSLPSGHCRRSTNGRRRHGCL